MEKKQKITARMVTIKEKLKSKTFLVHWKPKNMTEKMNIFLYQKCRVPDALALHISKY